MLNLMKNPFAKSTPVPSAVPSAPAAEASLKGKQLLKGRTRSKVEELTGQLEAARLTLAQAEQVVGDQLIEGLDVTASTDAMKQAGDRVRVLESALAVARQKDDVAQAELKQAERQVAIDLEAAACARVLALGPRFEEVFTLVRQLAIDTAREGDALRVAGGNEKYAYGLNEIRAQFDLFLGLAKHPLTNNGHVPEAFKKYLTFSACLEAVCGHPRS